MRRKPKSKNFIAGMVHVVMEAFTGTDQTEFQEEVSSTVQEMLPKMDELMSEQLLTGQTGQEAFNQIRLLKDSFRNSKEKDPVIQVIERYCYNRACRMNGD